MPPIPGMVQWHSLLARHAKGIKEALHKVSKAIDGHLSAQSAPKAQPVLARNTPRQPLHPLARIRQNQSRWYSTARSSWNATVREFTSSASVRSGVKYERASFPTSRVSQNIAKSSGRAPFASSLRPSLTGGTLGRTAGGYSLGAGRMGGARYFSHGPASQAQVVQNVSQAMRAFFIGGQKAQYNGTSPYSGEKRYKAVTALQEETGRKMRSLPKATPGSYINFAVNPTITALTSMGSVAGFSMSGSASEANHLNTDGLLDVLSVDFSRALKDLSVVLNDLKRLSALGDLPITYEASNLRVHFPGCDADTIERLCDELSVQRGTVVQDESFDAFTGTEIALLFPFAPSGTPSEASVTPEETARKQAKKASILYDDMFSPAHDEAYSTQSDSGMDEAVENPWLSDNVSDSSGFESVHYSSGHDSDKHAPLEYQDFEGIYRFIEQCDSVRR